MKNSLCNLCVLSVSVVRRVSLATLTTETQRTQSGAQRKALCLLLAAFCLLLTASCRRDMQDQPKAKAYRASSFFKDGLSSRPIIEGTVPRGWLRTNAEFFTGKKSK